MSPSLFYGRMAHPTPLFTSEEGNFTQVFYVYTANKRVDTPIHITSIGTWRCCWFASIYLQTIFSNIVGGWRLIHSAYLGRLAFSAKVLK